MRGEEESGRLEAILVSTKPKQEDSKRQQNSSQALSSTQRKRHKVGLMKLRAVV